MSQDEFGDVNFEKLNPLKTKQKEKETQSPSNGTSSSKNNNAKPKSVLNSLGIKELESGLENSSKNHGSVLRLNNNLGLSSDKYLKECKEDEDPYDVPEEKQPEIKKPGEYKQITTATLAQNSGFGLIIPALTVLDMAVFVPKQIKPKCYRKSRKKIAKASVKSGGICYKDEDCESNKCDNNLFGLAEGRCEVRRQTINVEEGGLCANDAECKEDLFCDNWGFGMGQCKKPKKSKTKKNNKK